MDLTSPSEIKRIMNGLGRGFNKALGQNFLIDRSVLDEIVHASGIDERYGVIEIGPGIGTLTAELAKNAKKVVSIELDRQIAEYLKRAFAFDKNVEIINGDAMKTDFAELIKTRFDGMPCVLVANLPYYITTPIIMKLLEEEYPFESITVMIQKEVALRFAAKCGTKDYGAVSLAVQYYTDPCLITEVAPGCFMPPPKVTSEVIRLDIKDHVRPAVLDEAELFKVIKASFAQRRKTLVNGLSAVYKDIPKEQLKKIIAEIGGNENIRGEQLSLEQFIRLADALKS